MTNLPTIQLPQHLAVMAQKMGAINQAASAAIVSGGVPRISVKGSRFRFQTPDNQELVHQQLFLDVIIVGANQHLSKAYYAGKYDPNAEGVGPDCFSDNGVGPSIQSNKPQCGTCVACPFNVVGSKINEQTGSATKACGDSKKIAVLVADNTSGQVFELRIPYMSTKNLKEHINRLNAHGIPASSIVTRLSFAPDASYPQLMFAPAANQDGSLCFINAQQAQDVMEVLDSDEVKQVTGENDRPINPANFVRGAVAQQNVQAAGRTS